MTKQLYGEIFEKEFNTTTRFLMSQGIEYHHAEELSQAAWVKGFVRLEQLEDDTKILAWVNTIARRLYVDFRRRKKDFARLDTVISILPSDHNMDVNTVCIDIEKVLEMCLPRDKILFSLRLKGHEDQEISEITGIHSETVGVRICRATRYIRQKIEHRKILTGYELSV